MDIQSQTTLSLELWDVSRIFLGGSYYFFGYLFVIIFYLNFLDILSHYDRIGFQKIGGWV